MMTSLKLRSTQCLSAPEQYITTARRMGTMLSKKMKMGAGYIPDSWGRPQRLSHGPTREKCRTKLENMINNSRGIISKDIMSL